MSTTTQSTHTVPVAGKHAAAINDPSKEFAPRLEAIDGLRGLAAIAIFAYHVWQFCDSPRLIFGMHAVIAQMHCAVDLFIVLSGFCLFWPFVYRADALVRWRIGPYLKRRFMRIAPPYYASILLLLLLPNLLVVVWRVAGNPASWQVAPNIGWQLATHLTFIHTLFPSTWAGLQGCYWTLGLEAQLYIAFIFVLFIYRKIGMHVLWPMFALSIAYRLIVDAQFAQSPWPVGFLFSVTFLGRWMQFAAGMAAAYAVSRLITTRRAVSVWESSIFTAFALLLIVMATTRNQLASFVPVVMESTAYGVGFACIAFLAATGSGLSSVLQFRPLAAFGLMSYSFYLLHQNTAYYFSEGLEKVLGVHGAWEFLLMMTAGFVFVCGISIIFFQLIEKRCLKPKRHRPAGFTASGHVDVEISKSPGTFATTAVNKMEKATART